MVEVRVERVWKRFGSVEALRGVSLTVREGELFTLLGPSGCGKTTLLRIVAGLLEPDQGRIFFDGDDVTGVPPHKRNVGMVFQDLALFPHMTVYDNVAYGLRVRRVPEDEVRRRVREILELVRLDPGEFASRRPGQLSGGQQQRVALARALVIEPRVLLLDEPFSHLDYKIRQELMAEFKKLQKRLGITTIYVTHDQTEAMLLSDRIAVMNAGRVEQVGRPDEVYEKPRTLFVASFFGDANILPARLDGRATPLLEGGEGDGYIVVRYEKLAIDPEEPLDYVFEGVVEDVAFMGPVVRIEVRVGGVLLRSIQPRTDGMRLSRGSRVRVGWRSRDMWVLGR